MSEDTALAALLAHYEDACVDTRRRGREWYAEARRECRRISRATGVPYRNVAAVMAITSPDAQLSTNIVWTEDACRTLGIGRHGRYPTANAPKVWRALLSKSPGQYATGPKVNAFYRAIVGDPDILVVDRWASFAAGGPKDKVPGAKMRRTIEAAYRCAASTVGESVRDFQAIVWIQTRESTPDVRGRIRKLQDITS